MKKYNILVVDDEPANLQKLRRTFINDYHVLEAHSGEEAMQMLDKHSNISVIIADQRMPNMSGVEFLEKTIAKNPDIIRIILTGYTEVQDLIEAINTGRVYKYITKPWEPETLKMIIREALERLELIKENERLTKELHLAYERLKNENLVLKSEVQKNYDALENIVCDSQEMRHIFELIHKISPTDITVLIQGETGTGKELIARYIHSKSRRRDHIFIPVNCGAIPRDLIESEFFGHTKGAFTGASSDKKGLFEIADKGTIFLDEIGEAPPELQVKLLRVLQEGELLSLGSSSPKKIDVRIIASTNRNLKSEVELGTFRQDLFFRLNVVSILIPPLRERKDDIIPLAKYFLERASSKLKKRTKAFAPEVLETLSNYSWPGNVRELENEIERMVILTEENSSPGLELISDHVKGKMKAPITRRAAQQFTFRDINRFVQVTSGPTSEDHRKAIDAVDSQQLKTATEELEKILIKEALVKNGWNRTKAAQALGISRQSLITKIRRYNLR